MKTSKHIALGLAACWLAALVASAVAADDASFEDDVASRTERALFKMSQMEAGSKRVRVLTPARRVSAVEAPPVGPPEEMTSEGVPAPMPEGDSISQEHGAPLLDEGNYGGDYSGDIGGCGDCCDDCGCESCCGSCCECLCGPPGSCWVRADVLGWWTSGMKVPALVTAGVDQDQPGVIGEPGTRILFGDERINDRARIGGRITAGTWLDECHDCGIEADYFGIDDDGTRYVASGLDYPFLSRPIIDVTDGLPGENGVEAVNNEDLCGQVTVNANTGFQGAGAAFRHKLYCCTHDCCE